VFRPLRNAAQCKIALKSPHALRNVRCLHALRYVSLGFIVRGWMSEAFVLGENIHGAKVHYVRDLIWVLPTSCAHVQKLPSDNFRFSIFRPRFELLQCPISYKTFNFGNYTLLSAFLPNRLLRMRKNGHFLLPVKVLTLNLKSARSVSYLTMKFGGTCDKIYACLEREKRPPQCKIFKIWGLGGKCIHFGGRDPQKAHHWQIPRSLSHRSSRSVRAFCRYKASIRTKGRYKTSQSGYISPISREFPSEPNFTKLSTTDLPSLVIIGWGGSKLRRDEFCIAS